MIFIYALICVKTNFTYVGITYDLRRRFREHRSRLSKGRHRAPAMIADWREYGERAFKMTLLETLPEGTSMAEAREAELRWQARFAKQRRLYITYSTVPAAKDWRHKRRGTRRGAREPADQTPQNSRSHTTSGPAPRRSSGIRALSDTAPTRRAHNDGQRQNTTVAE